MMSIEFIDGRGRLPLAEAPFVATLCGMLLRGHALRDRSLVRALRWLAMVVVLTLAATPAPAASLRSADGVVLVARALAAEAAPVRIEQNARARAKSPQLPVRATGFRLPNDGRPVAIRAQIYLLDCALLR